MILYQARGRRWAYAVAMLGSAALGLTFIDVVFLPDYDLLPTEPQEFGMFERAFFGLFTAIAAFLTVYFAYGFIRNPVYFRMTEEGFEYSPGGVSTGLVRWTEIEEIKFTSVGTGGGDQNRRRVIGIFLKDPHSYIARFPTSMHALFEVRKFQSGTPLVFQSGEFGGKDDQVMLLMQEQLRKVQGSASAKAK